MEKRRKVIADQHQDRIPAHKMPDYLPGAAYQALAHRPDSDVQVQIYKHRSTAQSLIIPAVAEPLLVFVVAGAALVEERLEGEEWTSNAVEADDFFLTMSQEPYEMRWQTEADAGFEVLHVYLGQRLLDSAARDVYAGRGAGLRLQELSGARDAEISQLMRLLYREATSHSASSHLYLQGVGQALAVHLVRHFRDKNAGPRPVNALPAYKLHRAINRMRERLDEEFSLSLLAREADMSHFHFSRMFRRATGRSPSQYFIEIRMETARQLLLGSDRSIIDVALEVGYSSPSHFAQVFKRHSGKTPREYRQQ